MILYNFHPDSVAADAMSVTTVYIDHVPIPVPPPHPDACEYTKSGISCPLKAHKSYAFHETVDILEMYPKVFILYIYRYEYIYICIYIYVYYISYIYSFIL